MYFSDMPTVDWRSGVDTRNDRCSREASPKDALESSPSTERGGATGATGERARARAKVLCKSPASERPPTAAEMSAWASRHEGPVSIGGGEAEKRRRALMDWSDDEIDYGEPVQTMQTPPASPVAGTPPASTTRML